MRAKIKKNNLIILGLVFLLIIIVVGQSSTAFIGAAEQKNKEGLDKVLREVNGMIIDNWKFLKEKRAQLVKDIANSLFGNDVRSAAITNIDAIKIVLLTENGKVNALLKLMKEMEDGKIKFDNNKIKAHLVGIWQDAIKIRNLLGHTEIVRDPRTGTMVIKKHGFHDPIFIIMPQPTKDEIEKSKKKLIAVMNKVALYKNGIGPIAPPVSLPTKAQIQKIKELKKEAMEKDALLKKLEKVFRDIPDMNDMNDTGDMNDMNDMNDMEEAMEAAMEAAREEARDEAMEEAMEEAMKEDFGTDKKGTSISLINLLAQGMRTNNPPSKGSGPKTEAEAAELIERLEKENAARAARIQQLKDLIKQRQDSMEAAQSDAAGPLIDDPFVVSDGEIKISKCVIEVKVIDNKKVEICTITVLICTKERCYAPVTITGEFSDDLIRDYYDKEDPNIVPLQEFILKNLDDKFRDFVFKPPFDDDDLEQKLADKIKERDAKVAEKIKILTEFITLFLDSRAGIMEVYDADNPNVGKSESLNAYLDHLFDLRKELKSLKKK